MFSKRLDRITPSATLEMTAQAAKLRSQGIDVLNFSVGEPDFNTPQHIVNAAIYAMNQGFTKYTPGSGTYEIKQAVCTKLLRDNKLHYKPENIIVSCGGKHALYNACQVLFEKGDEVIIFSPYWVSFPDFVSVTGAKSCVYNAKDLAGVLSKNFSSSAINNVKITSSGMNSDIHASSNYRANMVKTFDQKAVDAC